MNINNLIQTYLESEADARFALAKAHFPTLEGKAFETFADVFIDQNSEDFEGLRQEAIAQVLTIFESETSKLMQFIDYLALNFCVGRLLDNGFCDVIWYQKLKAIDLLQYSGIVPSGDLHDRTFYYRNHQDKDPLIDRLRFVEKAENSGLYPDWVIPFLMSMLHPEDYRDVGHNVGRMLHFYTKEKIVHYINHLIANPNILKRKYPNSEKIPPYTLEEYLSHLYHNLSYSGFGFHSNQVVKLTSFLKTATFKYFKELKAGMPLAEYEAYFGEIEADARHYYERDNASFGFSYFTDEGTELMFVEGVLRTISLDAQNGRHYVSGNHVLSSKTNLNSVLSLLEEIETTWEFMPQYTFKQQALIQTDTGVQFSFQYAQGEGLRLSKIQVYATK
ncbi:hypothetical protein [Hugenholtzia roseola]|uniref:hypothetical protein n=1 Tax=Hugenholtzia roseola TaxID=1002 RepID=UPI0012B679F6|nr:hypothetical protein [Hugenholtzia roseola]